MPSLRNKRSEETRDRIISSAIELIAEESYRSISMIDIEARSKVSRGSIPWHFGNKEGLLQAVVKRLRDDGLQRFSVEVPTGGAGSAYLASRASLAIQGPLGRARLNLLFEAIDPASPIHDSFAEIHTNARAFYRRWLERPEVAAGLPDGTDLDALSAVVFGGIMGINHQWALMPGDVDFTGAHLTLFRTLFPYLTWDELPLNQQQDVLDRGHA